MDEQELRKQIVMFGIKMLEEGLTRGTGGNISVRLPNKDEILITPSSVEYAEMRPSFICKVDLDGELIEDSTYKPSSETPMHTLIYSQKKEVNAIFHTHSPYASTIATAGMEIPPIYYQSALIGGSVPIANYATYGTKEIGLSALRALGNKPAVLLERHGVLTVGPNLKSAYKIAVVVEELARIFYQTMSAGITPKPLSKTQIIKIRNKAGL